MFIGRTSKSSQIQSAHLPPVNVFIYVCVWGGVPIHVCHDTVSVDNLGCHSSSSAVLRPLLFVTALTRLAGPQSGSSESNSSHQAWQQAPLPLSHLMGAEI